MRKHRKRKVLEDVEVVDIVARGKGFATMPNGKALFIDDAVPGDVVDVLVRKNTSGYVAGRVLNMKKPSEDRIDSFCEHFGTCGGCKWQYLDYQKQLEYKEKIVGDNFRRLGKLEFDEIRPIIGTKEQTFYRNKMEYTFSSNRWIDKHEVAEDERIDDRRGVGFYVPSSFLKVVDIKKCHLQGGGSNEVRNFLRDYAVEHDLTFYNLLKHTGFLRNLIVRTTVAGELMIVLQVAEQNQPLIEQVMEALLEQFPEVTSLNYVINQKRNDTMYDQEVITYHGQAFITEYLEELKFKISPKSFFQTNPKQALELYSIIRDFADLKGEELVYDLYTGTGSIAQFVSRYCKHVVGIEEVADAIKDAKYNSEQNELTNCDFIVGDVRKEFTAKLLEKYGTPDLIITDPPRAGLHPDVVRQLNQSGAERIVYVSCNPATQARDLGLMKEHYKIEKIQPVDMFPFTYHIENVVLLSKI